MSATENEATGGGASTSGEGIGVADAVKLVGDLGKAAKDAVVAGSVVMTMPEDERGALQRFISRCQAQKQAVDAIREANKANRPPSRQRASTKGASKGASKGSTKG